MWITESRRLGKVGLGKVGLGKVGLEKVGLEEGLTLHLTLAQ
jgi:hypothetical protein